MSENTKYFFLGYRKTLPLVVGVIPFGIMYASIARHTGFSPELILFISCVVFGGASQLVFVDLIFHLTSPIMACFGAQIINARHLVYSAAVSRDFNLFSLKWRIILSYFLTDQFYAFYTSESKTAATLNLLEKPWYYLGSGLCTWSFWIGSTIVGTFLEELLPKSWNLSFAIPLIFLPLVIKSLQEKGDFVICLIAAISVYFLQKLPFGLGLFISIVAASLCGYLINKKLNQKDSSK